jgi:hypothetical protein
MWDFRTIPEDRAFNFHSMANNTVIGNGSELANVAVRPYYTILSDVYVSVDIGSCFNNRIFAENEFSFYDCSFFDTKSQQVFGDELVTQAPNFLLRSTESAGAAVGTSLVIGATTYTVRAFLAEPPDGVLTRLVLSRA